jgi:ubiquitin conjugation factor E4 B
MCVLMRDPVLLPASKVILDLSTIKGHLLSDPTDPFSRMPLRVEDLIPRTSLRMN